MNSQVLYLEDPTILEFEANVIETIPQSAGKIGLVLDRSYFYPTGGGQDHDTGTIDAARVVDVRKEGDRVIHVIEGSVSAGRVTGRIDADRRLRNSQHHTAQHLLTGCFLELFNLDTLSAHINGFSPSTLDIPTTAFSRADLNRVEDRANAIIYENRSVKAYFVTPEELGRLPLRRQPKVSEDIRIIEINAYDYTPCGGTHCAATGIIGQIKILKTERPNKEITRVLFAAGLQALDIFREEHEIVSGLSGQFGANPRDLSALIQKQAEQLRFVQEMIRTMQAEQLTLESSRIAQTAEIFAGKRVTVASFTNRPAQELRSLAGEMKTVEGLIAVLCSYDGQKISLLVVCGPGAGISARDILNRLLALSGGRGGGDSAIAQGGGTVLEEQARAFSETARSLLKEMLA